MNQYEAMFLFDPGFATSFDNCESEIKRLMERAEAELLFCKKWDERRLAFKVSGRKRGVYVLVYFKAGADKLAPLERDVKLSEDVLRVLILKADGVTPEMMEKAIHSREASAEHPRGDRERRPGPPGKGDASRKADAPAKADTSSKADAPAEKTEPVSAAAAEADTAVKEAEPVSAAAPEADKDDKADTVATESE